MAKQQRDVVGINALINDTPPVLAVGSTPGAPLGSIVDRLVLAYELEHHPERWVVIDEGNDGLSYRTAPLSCRVTAADGDELPHWRDAMLSVVDLWLRQKTDQVLRVAILE